MMKIKKKYLLPLIVLVTTILAFLAVFVPLPYYIEVPGTAEDVRNVVTVSDQEDTAPGAYQFVTIGVYKATGLDLLRAALTPFTDIYSESDMTGGASDVEFYRINQFYMETSQNMAKYQALTLAGKEATMDFLGVYVLQVMDNSTFKGILNIADTVVAINGERFESSKELIEFVSSFKVGDKVTVGYIEDGQNLEAQGKIIKLDNGKNGIGISLVDRTEIKGDTDIVFNTENIGGPSAGLMFTLAIYTQLAEPELRDGRIIAGTGSINKDGTVGDIGGVDKKVVAADAAGASVFFVPNNPVDKEVLKEDPNAKTNYEEALAAAKQIKTKMKIVPVKTAQEAIDYLKKDKK